MRTIVILWVVLFAIIGCGNDQIRNSPPVVDHLIIPDAVSPGDSVELQVVAHDADGDTLIYVWEVDKGETGFKDGANREMDGPFRSEGSDCYRFCK